MQTKESRDKMRSVIINYFGDREVFILDPCSEHYMVSNLGRVLSLRTNKYLKLTKGDRGYINVKIYENGEKKTTMVHRIVARAFLNNLDYEVNHINANKSDNRLVNLELVTRQENLKHAKDNNLYLSRKGKENPSFRFTTEIVDDMIALQKAGLKLKEIADKYNTSISYTCTMIKQRLGGIR